CDTARGGGDRKDGVILRTEAEVINRVRPQRRHAEGVSAGQIIARIRPAVLRVGNPIAVIRRIGGDTVARRDSVADVQYHVAGYLVERDVPVGGCFGRDLHAIIAPVRSRDDLVVGRAAVEGDVLNGAGGQFEPVARVGIGHG